MATLDNLEDWLIAIAEHTRHTAEALAQGRGGAGGGDPGSQRPGGGTGGPLGAVGRALGGLVSPLAQLATYVNASTTGMGLLRAATNLFAASVGQVLMPATFAMSYGLVSAARQVREKLGPAMDSFTRWVLATGIPAMTAFADVVGKATSALVEVANFRIGGKGGVGLADLLPGPRDGQLGALSRLTGGGDVERDPSAGGAVGLLGRVKQAGRIGSDVARLSPIGGDSLANAANWAMGRISRLNGMEGDLYSGAGTRRAGGTAAQEADLAKTRAELAFQMNPRSRIGSAAGNWQAAQNAVLGMSPFEQETLRVQREQLAKLDAQLAELRAGRETGGAYTAPAAPKPGG